MTNEALKSVLARAPQEYRTRKARAEKAVVRWEWWSKPRYPLDPLYNERNGWPVGRRMTKAPLEPTLQHTRSGFDAEGRVRVDREYIFEGRGYQEARFAKWKKRKWA
jgi:hypothetical protein